MSPSKSARPLPRWAMALLLLGTIVGFYWKLTLTRQYTWMRGPDLAEQVLPWLDLQAREWHAGRIPLWDPYLWCGQPLIGQGQPGVAYPLNWLLFTMPLRDGHLSPVALNWYYVAIHLMAAAFAYLFCRDQGRSRPASFAGGLIFALSGFLGTTDWPQMMNGAVWIPLVFLFQFRAARGHRTLASAALSGMFLGMAFLAGHHQVPMFTTVAWGLAWVWHLSQNRRLWSACALALVVMACTSAMQILPAYEYGHLARRWAGAPEPLEWNQPVPYTVHAEYDLKAYSLFGLVFVNAKAHYDPFVGVVGLTLALFAIAVWWNDPRVRWLTVIGAGALVYSLGHNSVYQGFLYAITPDLDKARTPSAIVGLMQFAAGALAAFGIDQLSGESSAIWLRRIRWILLAFGVVALTIALQAMVTNRLIYPADDRVILTGVIALVLAAMLMRPAASVVPLILLLVFELGNSGQFSLMHTADPKGMQWINALKSNPDIAAYLQAQRDDGFPRVEIANDLFAANWGAWYGLETNGGNLASLTRNVVDSEFYSPTGHLIWGIRYIVANQPDPKFGDEVMTGHSGLKLYRRANAFPRVWTVHRFGPVAGRDAEAYRAQASIAGPPPQLQTCDGQDRVELKEHLPDRLTIHAEMACTGMVILSDSAYPGWRARLDHRPTTLYEVNGAMRGVLAPKGVYDITMRYRPVSVYLGAALTLAGVLGAVFAHWRIR